jgi:hypothetical protein
MSMLSKVKAMALPDLAHIIEVQDEFTRMAGKGDAGPEALAEFLDALDHRARVAAVRALCPSCLKKLYDRVDGFRKVTIDDLVSPKLGMRKQVRHFGKNSLPAFTIFEKRFMRPEAGSKELWGYNFQALAPVTGPGYFVAYDAADRGEVDIDYTQIPSWRPEDWPAVQSNERGLSNLVYAHMVDKLRGITQHVSIGRAWKKGKVQNAWFILCRE